MKNQKAFSYLIWTILLTTAFIAVYPLFINYHFQKSYCYFLFSIFYLTSFINFLGEYKDENKLRSKINWIATNRKNIIINTIIIALFAIILIRAEISIIRVFLILLCGQILSFVTLIFLNRTTLTYLMWVVFYLFAGGMVLQQFPVLNLDLISRTNPYGGLFIYLIGR